MMIVQAVEAMTVDFQSKIPAVRFAAGEIRSIADDEAALMAVFNYDGRLRFLRPDAVMPGGYRDLTDDVLVLLKRIQLAILENDAAAFAEVVGWIQRLLGTGLPQDTPPELIQTRQLDTKKTVMQNLIELYRDDGLSTL